MIARWNRHYSAKIETERSRTPDFKDKIPKLFWRGGDSGLNVPLWKHYSKAKWLLMQVAPLEEGKHDDRGVDQMATDQRNETNWFRWPRLGLCILSNQVPALIDAKITNSHYPHLAELYRNADIMAPHRIPIEEQLAFKYVIHIDGSSTSDRLHWMLKSKSLVFIQETPIKVWAHRGLVAYKHYIPVQEDLSNLVDQILWAEQHSEKAAEIVEAANDFASLWMNFDAVAYYFHTALHSYATTVWEG